MKIKKNKKLLLLAATSAVAVSTIAVVALYSNSEFIRTRGSGEIVAGSISWDSSCQKTTHSSNRVSYKTNTERGTNVILYSIGQYNVSSDYIFSSKKSDYLKQGLFVSSEEGTSESLFKFQGITSVTVVAAASSETGAGFGIYTSSDSEGSPVYIQTVGGIEDEHFVITSEIIGTHYFAIKATNTSIINIKSVTISYSCEPGGQPTEEYNISYYGMDEEYNLIDLEGIDTSSLVYRAEKGSSVEFTPAALSGYSYLGGFGMEETAVEDVYSDENGTLSFTMPGEDVAFVLVTRSTSYELSSITLDTTNAKTEFNLNDTFSSAGLVITANYSDGHSATIDNSDATFSGYDMSEASNQTVTVSYTEERVTKTATYSIAVKSGSSEVVLEGTYNYISRKSHSTPDWSLYNMTITFYNDGTCMWRNQRTNTLGNVFDCKVFFTYTATNNGVNITISMAISSYDFTKDGEYNNQAGSFSGGSYDRPVDGSFTSTTSKNNSGVMSLDRSSLTIDVYDQSHSYEVYDTFTFSLAA